MKNSPFLSLHLRDVIKGAITAALTSISTAVYTSLNDGALPSGNDWKTIGIAGAAAFLGYLLKNALTNSQDKFAKTEPK